MRFRFSHLTHDIRLVAFSDNKSNNLWNIVPYIVCDVRGCHCATIDLILHAVVMLCEQSCVRLIILQNETVRTFINWLLNIFFFFNNAAVNETLLPSEPNTERCVPCQSPCKTLTTHWNHTHDSEHYFHHVVVSLRISFYSRWVSIGVPVRRRHANMKCSCHRMPHISVYNDHVWVEKFFFQCVQYTLAIQVWIRLDGLPSSSFDGVWYSVTVNDGRLQAVVFVFTNSSQQLTAHIKFIRWKSHLGWSQ